ncbi:hypothetical protein EK21DRAFT_115276 [Setomelanomma holmii]|uniref:Uncharacterized protein n=1 Tax=Setomelanomma holmii TaxID=210430 RepID=A0A9P4H3Z9_9PLEO|nr:hypothetical protein EK21DRAFT_115276 [Setomelanomma holmii]
MKALEPLKKLPPVAVVPDYTRATVGLFTAVTHIILENAPEVTILSIKELTQSIRTAGLPSWVPYFCARGDLSFNLTCSRVNSSARCSDPRRRPHHIAFIDQPTPTLVLRGYRIDEVDTPQTAYEVRLGSALSGACTFIPDLKRAYADVLGWHKLLKRVTYYGPQFKWLALYYTIAGGQEEVPFLPLHMMAKLISFLSTIGVLAKGSPSIVLALIFVPFSNIL